MGYKKKLYLHHAFKTERIRSHKKTLREIRNDLTHEYPMMLDETIEKLNLLYNQLSLLEHILVTIEQKIQQ